MHPEKQYQRDAVTREMDEIRRNASHRAGYRGMVNSLDRTLANPDASRDDRAMAAHLKLQEVARQRRLMKSAARTGELGHSARNKEAYAHMIQSRGSLGVRSDSHYHNAGDAQLAAKSARAMTGGVNGVGADVAEEMASEAMYRLRRRQSMDVNKAGGLWKGGHQ